MAPTLSYDEWVAARPIPLSLNSNITVSDGTFKSSRGLTLHTRQWLPDEAKTPKPKGLIFVTHGYADSVHGFIDLTASVMADNGWAVFGLDHDSHGKSATYNNSPRVCIDDFDAVVSDAAEYFKSIQGARPGFRSFLYGESMGGGIALMLQIDNKLTVNGAILVAPMCEIAKEMMPPAFVVATLKTLSKVMPKAPLAVTPDVLDRCFKQQEIVPWAKQGPFFYGGWPRLKTATEMLRVTDYIASNSEKVTYPMLVCHGSADTVTALHASQALVEKASSKDKELKVYDGMWHALTAEPEENRKVLFADIFAWLDKRV